MTKISLKSLEENLTRDEMRVISGGSGTQDGFGCKKCTNNSDCPGDGVCASYSGTNCAAAPCGCGKYCM